MSCLGTCRRFLGYIVGKHKVKMTQIREENSLQVTEDNVRAGNKRQDPRLNTPSQADTIVVSRKDLQHFRDVIVE